MIGWFLKNTIGEMNVSCPFCLNGGIDPAEPPFWAVESRILQKLDHCYICVGYGPQVSPYLLVAPYQHSISTVSNLVEVKFDIMRALSICLSSGLFKSGALTVFEHGGRSGSSCLEHCHLHVIDGKYDLKSIFCASRDVTEGDFFTFPSNVGVESYLFSGTFKDNTLKGYFSEDSHCGSQYFRRLLAATLRVDRFDWRTIGNTLLIEKTMLGWKKSKEGTPPIVTDEMLEACN